MLRIFRLSAAKDWFTATIDRSGRNLPAGEHLDGVTWIYVRDVDETQLPDLVFNAKDAGEAFAQSGYFHLEKKQWKDKRFFDRLIA
ncbi:hypothetical protein [Hyphomicrobium sp. ghe19]|uniref:hypothetical protein n=1 Tax=Hyphomicrobium sp. ghe19 TaxID=2682968 RepID=UPI001367880E|nr:hypothetical protein HYPP_03790 [Hyphomicrobium sp. ghe19]